MSDTPIRIDIDAVDAAGDLEVLPADLAAAIERSLHRRLEGGRASPTARPTTPQDALAEQIAEAIHRQIPPEVS